MLSQNPPTSFQIGGLYVAGFTQARAPHIGLLVATSEQQGILFHIRIDRATSPYWQYQQRIQPLARDMFLSSLLCIAKGPFNAPDSLQTIDAAARALCPPLNDEFGHCASWVLDLIEILSAEGLCTMKSKDQLALEINQFAQESKAYARRNRFPNVANAVFCY
ncbi:hypothetical protein ONZ45_g16372 [Pleurotus djamor]|nr:hypothetical protein ONZ45_g16372 [Pleurotus djamor]